MNILLKLTLASLLLYGGHISAKDPAVTKDSVRIHFKQSKIDLLADFKDNAKSLSRITDSLTNTYSDSIYRLLKVEVVGGASPEGSVKFNKWLSERRAEVLFNYISHFSELPDSIRTFTFLGRDWHGLIDMVKNDPDVPYQAEVISLLENIAYEVDNNNPHKGGQLTRIQKLRGGVPYKYMYDRLFPNLRASKINLWYSKVYNQIWTSAPCIPVNAEGSLHGIGLAPLPLSFSNNKFCKPFYMGIYTNMLYDALAVPNLGVEFYLGKNLTIGANWMYAWWKTDRRHRYWRTYGGDLHLRYWFGKAAKEKPITGHHLGIYAQTLTYDFEWGGKGYMGGEPGGTLWDRANWAAGVEYGYSLPIARRLNIDFTLGIGYLWGRYYEYIPDKGHYVWQATKNRHWFGPTKAEVSLVWLIGCDNFNRKK